MMAAMLDRTRGWANFRQQPPAASRAALGGGEALIRRELALGRAEGVPALMPDLIYIAAVPLLGQPEGLRLAAKARKMLQGTPWEQDG